MGLKQKTPQKQGDAKATPKEKSLNHLEEEFLVKYPQFGKMFLVYLVVTRCPVNVNVSGTPLEAVASCTVAFKSKKRS